MGWFKKDNVVNENNNNNSNNSSSNNNNAADNNTVNSLLGKGSRFVGNLSPDGGLRVDGEFLGNIKSRAKVVLGENCHLQGNVEAGSLVIGGYVKGDITAVEKITVLSSAMVLGNITSPKLTVEDGVIINGNCCIAVPKKEVASPSPAVEPKGKKG